MLSRRLSRRPGVTRSVFPDWALTVRLEPPEGSLCADEPWMFGPLTSKITFLQAYADQCAYKSGLQQPLCASIFVKGVEGSERTAQQLREWWEEKCTKMGHGRIDPRQRAGRRVSLLARLLVWPYMRELWGGYREWLLVLMLGACLVAVAQGNARQWHATS